MGSPPGEQDALDLSWLRPWLAIGGRIAPGAACRLASDHGIRRVIDLRAEEQDDEAELRCHGIELLTLPVPDLQAVPQAMLTRGVRWARESDGRVLVHCQHGIGRSALLCCCILVAEGYGPVEALEFAKQTRWKVSPSPSQLEAFLTWCTNWYREANRKLPPVSWDALAAIAYRHLHGRS